MLHAVALDHLLRMPLSFSFLIFYKFGTEIFWCCPLPPIILFPIMISARYMFGVETNPIDSHWSYSLATAARVLEVSENTKMILHYFVSMHMRSLSSVSWWAHCCQDFNPIVMCNLIGIRTQGVIRIRVNEKRLKARTLRQTWPVTFAKGSACNRRQQQCWQ